MKNTKKNFKELFFSTFCSKMPWELFLAIIVNIIIALVFFALNSNLPKKATPEVEISVDITDYSIPKPKEMNIKEHIEDVDTQLQGMITESSDIEKVTKMPSKIEQDFINQSIDSKSQVKNSFELQQELVRIEQNIKTFEGINNVKTNIQDGALGEGLLRGSSFDFRSNAEKRAKSLKRYGGNEKTENAVEKALKYLSSVQNKDGSWGSQDSFKSSDAVALTSFALLAFLSHGENFQSKLYGENIRNGCDFLIEIANSPNIEYTGHGFGHAILTYALAECYALTGSLSVKEILTARVKFIVKNQNKFGSFAVNYDNLPQAPPSVEQQENPLFKEIIAGEPACNLSLLGWHIQALTAAKNAGIKVENLDQSLDLATEALVKIHQAKRGGFSQGINMKRFEHNENMTSVGLLSINLLNASKSAVARRAKKILKEAKLLKWSSQKPLYRWYYHTQALFQSEKGRGKTWKIWNENLKSELLNAQQFNGSWIPVAENKSFATKDKTDLSVYATSLAALMLQVYYRYLPSYSIAESKNFANKADDYDLGGGVITRLPGGVDPLATVILGTGTTSFPTVLFGKFNSVPSSNKSELSKGEFNKIASMRSTVAVRKKDDLIQCLQPNQRVAIFLDEFTPRNFKGNMLLSIGIVSSDKEANDYKTSLEIAINGKRLYNAIILREKQLIELIIPNDVMQSYGNILQIRNNGKSIFAFDAIKLSSINRSGKKLYLLGTKVPYTIQNLFSKNPPKDTIFCPLSAIQSNRQLLPEIKGYDVEKIYIAEYSATGSEYMGNNFHEYYTQQTAREIVDWIAGGGNGVKINNIETGGKFYDTVFKKEYNSVFALKQIAKLFVNSALKLPAQIYPKYGEKPIIFSNAVSSYNAAGVSTIVIAKRFATPEELELISIVPWNGETEVIIEKGLSNNIKTDNKKITIKNNIFRLSDSFPELTVIRLVKKGYKNIPFPKLKDVYKVPATLNIHISTVQNMLPQNMDQLKKQKACNPKALVQLSGDGVSKTYIPATETDEFKPTNRDSINITFSVKNGLKTQYNSAYILVGHIDKNIEYLTFDVFARANVSTKRNNSHFITFRFVVENEVYSTTVYHNKWRKIVLPIKKANNLSWQNIRILAPANLDNKRLVSISYEINDIAVWSTFKEK